MRFAGAIFDLDGTLLDSMPAWATLGSDYLRAAGIEPPAGLDAALAPLSLAQAAVYLRDCGAPGTADDIVAGVNRMIAHFYECDAQPKPGAVGFVKKLAKAGVRLCVATATDWHLTTAALARLGILECFCGVLTCAAVGHGKDEPDIYEAARALLGTPKARTLVFEDAPHAIATARAAGFPVCAVYDASAPDVAAIRAAADCYIGDFSAAEEVLP